MEANKYCIQKDGILFVLGTRVQLSLNTASNDQYSFVVDGCLALMRELQESLYLVARQAELGGADSLGLVQRQAEQSLKLINSYLLSSQSEIGQTKLNFAPLGVGSIMHESAYSLRSDAGCAVSVVVGVNQPVMTHGELLKNLLSSTGSFIADVVQGEVVFRSFVTRKGDIGVGVFAQNFDLTPTDLRGAITNSGTSRMPMSRHSQKSGVMIMMAESIARALGGSLTVKRMGSFRGIVTMLPRSEQLTLIV